MVFPHQPVPLFVGREKSVRALEEAMRGEGKQILLATQKNKADDDPSPAAIYDVGVVATVLQLLKLPDGTVKVLVEGKARAGRRALHRPGRATTRPRSPTWTRTARARPRPRPCSRAVVEQFENYVKLNKKVPPEALASIPQIDRARQAGRPHRRAPVGEDRRQAAACWRSSTS